MNENYIRKLIRLVEESEIESLEVSSWGRKVRIVQRISSSQNGHGDGTHVVVAAHAPAVAAAPIPAAAPAAATSPAPAAPTEDLGNLVPVKSPMVGTFYAAPSPDSDPYVSLNQKISVGQIVCIVEAMKLMNEIESEVSGRITRIMVENAQPVEFGQTLFLIEPD
ncbi:MAG TPA: acetyl-CoA carboxylase biotin carboxyl carrier protein [candidate division Zixibacteria bacterium]|nr:acetyl-CoA carboxylase biotin carboxyl carrier protein [candidate division Zixibacteria bacterium]